jgi:hypothetical protein
MDLLLSLPILSYWASNSLTSWSASLNILFFYLTWSTLVLSHNPVKIELIGVATLRVIFWLLPSLLFLLLDTLVPSLAKDIKHGYSAALPPRDAATLAGILALASANLILSLGVEFGASLGLATVLQTPVFRTSTTLPLPWQMVKHVAVLVAARELLTYSIHRYVLHERKCQGTPRSTTATATTRRSRWPWPFRRSSLSLADLHAKHAHARSAPPFSLLVMADHPLPFLLHRFVPTYVPAVVLSLWGGKVHLLTYFVFVAMVTLEETLAMSGYSIVPGIIMGGMASRTALHYARPSAGNYGCLGLTDWVAGTSVGRDVIKDLRDEAGKHGLRERGENVVEGVGAVVQNRFHALRRSKRPGAPKGRVSSGSE